MRKYVSMFIVVAVAVATGCKEKPSTDPMLVEALGIQDEGIHIGMAVDSLLDAKVGADTSAQTIRFVNKWKERVALWRDAMVDIPGVEHDHSHGAHDHHDHDHDHNHANQNLAEGMSPEEIKLVQLSWKKEIEAIRDSIR